MHEVKKFFKPEFLNRLDSIIVFQYLEQDQVKQIAQLFINELTGHMKEQGITLDIDNRVVEKMA